MDRRRFLLGVGALFPWATLARALEPASPRREEAIAAWRGRLKTLLVGGIVPVIDTEATFNPQRMRVGPILDAMEGQGIAQIAFAPVFDPVKGSGASLELHRLHPAHFIPTTSDGVNRHWFAQDGLFVEQVRAEVTSGAYFFMGEHEIRHYPSDQQIRSGREDQRDITIPIGSPDVQAIFRLGETSGLALQIHYEIEDALLPPLEETLARYPRAKVVWCHLGQVRYPDRARRYGPDYVRGLIARFPNLHFDLAVPGPRHVYPGSGARDSTIYEEAADQPPYGGYLKSEWKAVLEDHPERFLAASDIDASRAQHLGSAVQRLRELILDSLSERARHLISYQNAWRLITGETWKG